MFRSVFLAALLAACADAAPAVLGAQLHPPGSGLRPFGVYVAVPATVAPPGVRLAARFDLTAAAGTNDPPPAMSAAVEFSPARPLALGPIDTTPYAALGVGTITYVGGDVRGTWTAHAGMRAFLPGRPFGLSVEGRATRGGLGVGLGVVLRLEAPQ